MFPLSKFILLTLALFVVRLAATTDINLEESNTDASHLVNDPIETSIPESQQQTPDERFRAMIAKTPGRRLHKIGQGSREDIEALRRVFQQNPSYNWNMWKNGDKPNCYIEVQVVSNLQCFTCKNLHPQRVPGKCTKLGGTIPACQSQDLLTIDYTSCGP